MPTNDFLPFGTAVGANVMTQADYLALSARSAGFSAGTAKSAQLNKTWRQASIMATVLAQFIVDQSGQNAVDDGTTATLQANLLTALRAAGRQATILNDTGIANAYAAANSPALSALPATGYSQRVNIANANTGAATYSPDGLAAKPIYGLGLQPLQGGELPAGIAVLMYLVQAGVNGGNGAWIIIESLGGASQIANGTKSRHALAVGQIPSETLGGAALVATQALTDAGADDATVVTPKKLRFGFSSIFANNGYIVFPSWLGGFIIQWIRTTNLGTQGASSSFPLAFPTACFGVWGSSTNGSTPTTISVGAITLTTFTAYGGTVPVSFGAIAFGR